MAYSVRYTTVGGTASQTELTPQRALEVAQQLASAGHKDIVVEDELGEPIDAHTLSLAVKGNRFPDNA